MTRFTVRPVRASDRAEWLRMLEALHTDTVASDHEPPVDAFLTGTPHGEHLPIAVFVAEADGEGELVGFIEISVRNYAEGCDGDTPHVESWFVNADVRGQGIGAALMASAEGWAREKGFAELASDALLDNSPSHDAHRAVGFEEVDRVVHFRKSL